MYNRKLKTGLEYRRKNVYRSLLKFDMPELPCVCEFVKTVVIYNQGMMDNDKLKEVLKPFQLDSHIIGDAVNVGTVVGRQKCFEYIWAKLPETQYISEIRPDMIFAPHWEDALVDFLGSHDEPVISCGIVDQKGTMPFLNQKAAIQEVMSDFSEFLVNLRSAKVVRGFTCPCVHVSSILKQTGVITRHSLKVGNALRTTACCWAITITTELNETGIRWTITIPLFTMRRRSRGWV